MALFMTSKRSPPFLCVLGAIVVLVDSDFLENWRFSLTWCFVAKQQAGSCGPPAYFRLMD